MASEDSSEVQHKTSTTDLLSSAQVHADAAKETLQQKTVDKSKVAGAAAGELLNAASEYGILGQESEQYVEKAETFIKQHGSPGKKPKEETKEETKSEKPEESGGSGGVGDIMKMVQGFLK